MKQYTFAIKSVFYAVLLVLIGEALQIGSTMGTVNFSTFGLWNWLFQGLYWIFLILGGLLIAIEEQKENK
jgi:hypothetical protein